jgi:hypothetical protein
MVNHVLLGLDSTTHYGGLGKWFTYEKWPYNNIQIHVAIKNIYLIVKLILRDLFMNGDFVTWLIPILGISNYLS